jgi:hypothetical protein
VTDSVVDMLASLRVGNPTLSRKQLFASVDMLLAENKLPPVPEHVKRAVLLKADMQVQIYIRRIKKVNLWWTC